ISNVALPSSSQSVLSSAFSLVNNLLPPQTAQELLSATFSVSNTTLTTTTPQQLLSPAFSVSNTSIGATTQMVVIGPALLILNSNPLTSQTQQALLQGAAINPLISELRSLSISLEQPVTGDRLVAGQTIRLRADAAGPETI